jgi:hypothetical protein
VLRTPVSLHGRDLTTVAEFDVSAGQSIPFVLTHGSSHLPPPDPIDPEASLAGTEAFWTEWTSRAGSGGEWADAVVRSLVTLEALTYAPTGGIVAPPRPRCRNGSVANAIGITSSVGCAMPR